MRFKEDVQFSVGRLAEMLAEACDKEALRQVVSGIDNAVASVVRGQSHTSEERKALIHFLGVLELNDLEPGTIDDVPGLREKILNPPSSDNVP